MSVNASGPVNRVVVTGDGQKVSSLAGSHLLGALAERLGVAGGFSRVLAGTTQRASAYDRGVVLTQLSMMLAAGGRCLSDLRVLRLQPDLFGRVASDATAWRAVHQVDERLLARLREVRVAATRRLLAAADTDTLKLDVDATLVDIDSERKQGAAAMFKGTFGFAPMVCTVEPVGVIGGGRLRPGNATANNAADQLAVIDEAIDSLPAAWRAGHRPGDQPFKVNRRLVVRGDTAACSKAMLNGLVDRNLVFSVGLRASQAAATVVTGLNDDVWTEAIDTSGRPRPALIAEVDDLVPDWAPQGTRAIVRRERAHPGASLRLWDHDGWRHQVTLTNDTQTSPGSSYATAVTPRSKTASKTSKTPAWTGCRSTPSTPTRCGSNSSSSRRCCSPESRPSSTTTNCRSPNPDGCDSRYCTSPPGSSTTPDEPGSNSTGPGPGHPNSSPPTTACPRSRRPPADPNRSDRGPHVRRRPLRHQPRPDHTTSDPTRDPHPSPVTPRNHTHVNRLLNDWG